MTKIAALCFLLSHGPSTPLDLGRGYEAPARAAYLALTYAEAEGAVEFQQLAGRYELRRGTDRIALHEECRK